jgi:hypothetical protein
MLSFDIHPIFFCGAGVGEDCHISHLYCRLLNILDSAVFNPSVC